MLIVRILSICHPGNYNFIKLHNTEKLNSPFRIILCKVFGAFWEHLAKLDKLAEKTRTQMRECKASIPSSLTLHRAS